MRSAGSSAPRGSGQGARRGRAGGPRPRWRRARRAPAGPRASTRSRPTRRRAPTSRALSDPDSRLMRKSKQHEYRQAYNAQAVVDAGGSQLIVGARVTNCASDRAGGGHRGDPVLGRPATVLADNGYANGARSRRLPRAMATGSSGVGGDFRPAKTEVPVNKAEWLKVMAVQARQRGRPWCTGCASRPSSRSSASSRRPSASPDSRCAASSGR